MVSMEHLARIVEYDAARNMAARSWRLVTSSSSRRSSPVAAMMLLANRMGSRAAPSTPQRFAATWEQNASLRLRAR